jgi:L-alanine-DL-glutamate epimerase-like enolase superfamily enzyme
VKIKRIEILPITYPYRMPLGGTQGRSKADYIILRMKTDEGIEGIGSGTVYFPRTMGETQVSAMSKLKFASETIIGQDPLNSEKILGKVDEVLFSGNTTVKVNIDYALFDLMGKIMNVPAYVLLGGLCREKVKCEWIVTLNEPKAMAEMTAKYLEGGFRSFKVKVTNDVKLAVARFKAVRDVVGPDIPLGVDMNMYTRASDAVEVIQALVPYGLNFAEDPTMEEDIDGMLRVKKKVNVPIVADQAAFSVYEAQRIIKAEAADSFHFAPCRVGGFRKSMQYRTLIESANLDYALSNYLGISISHAALAHFAVSCPKRDRFSDEVANILYLIGGTATAGCQDDICEEINGEIKDGFLYPPKGPGLGIKLNEKIVDKFITPGVSKIVVE